MSDSSIGYNKSGHAVVFSGPDAVRCYQAAVLLSGISLLQKGIRPHRNWTMKRALAMVSTYTGKTYKHGDADQAKADLHVWVQMMKSALPTVEVK